MEKELKDVWDVICILGKYRHFEDIRKELEIYYLEKISNDHSTERQELDREIESLR